MAKTGELKKTIRLDHLLVERGFFATRSRARDAILRGTVSLDRKIISKPGQPVSPDAEAKVEDPARSWVSRSALKLIAALDYFGMDPKNEVALDLGASTGGFTEVLLSRGAERVFAVDVGHGQLHSRLRDDARVLCLEHLNARDLTPEHLGGAEPGLLVCDTSFISLKLVLPPALSLARPGAKGVFLVKPQFEAGRHAIGKAGTLRDPALGGQIAKNLSDWLDKTGTWRSIGIIPSPIEGADGNAEYLLAGEKRH